MKYSSMVVAMSVLSMAAQVAAAAGDGSAILDGGWRISAGGVYDSGMKSNLRFSPRQAYSPAGFSGGAGLSRQKAQELAHGKTEGTKTTYVNKRKGAESWVDTANDGYAQDDGIFTYSFPQAVWDGGTSFELGYAEYEEFTPMSGGSAANFSDRDEAAMFGINVELSRNLYHDAEYGWGLDAAFAVQYARHNRAFCSRSSWSIGRMRRESGYYNSTYRATGDLAEVLPGSTKDPVANDILWGDSMSLDGQGFFAIDPNDVVAGGDEYPDEYIAESAGSLRADGDYENLELMLLARPYYDVYDWLRVNGTLGVVVSRQSMEMSFSMLRDGEVDYRSNRDFSDWDVYGVGGLGLMLYYKDFTLSADFMARFLDDEMSISDRYYRGSVRRGHWMFKLSAGYEF